MSDQQRKATLRIDPKLSIQIDSGRALWKPPVSRDAVFVSVEEWLDENPDHTDAYVARQWLMLFPEVEDETEVSAADETTGEINAMRPVDEISPRNRERARRFALDLVGFGVAEAEAKIVAENFVCYYGFQNKLKRGETRGRNPYRRVVGWFRRFLQEPGHSGSGKGG